MPKSKSEEPGLEIKARVKGAENWKEWHKSNKAAKHSSSNTVYAMGVIGSLVYWVQAAVGFGALVTGVLKSIAWPAYLVYKFLENFYGIVR